MSTAAPTKAAPSKSKREAKREKEKDKGKAGLHLSAPNERLKTVVRRLPPNLPEEIFWQSVANWVSDETVAWKVYHQGKLGKKLNKENIPSRAYIAFKNEDQLLSFSRNYDGHLFRDKAGNETQAIVEFAPYQKIPPEKRKVDARLATIEKGSDEDFISFIESLNAAKESQEPVTLETLIAAAQPPPMPTTTPLLEALKAKQSADRDKEAIIRNHAHYKDPTILSAAKKEERKKRERDARDAGSSQKQAHGSSAATGFTVEALQAIGKKAAKRNAPPKPVPASSSKTGSGNATAMTPTPKSPPKGPKGRRAVLGSAAPVAAASSSQGDISKSAAAPDASQTAEAASAPTGPRRGRPVIGLASRHFEAALSGAGVGLGAGSGGERRARREREKDRIDLAPPADIPPSDAEGHGKAADGKDKVSGERAPRSPKRERRRKEGESVGASGSGSATKTEVKVPSILQRADTASAADAPVAGLLPRLDTAPGPTESTGGPSSRGSGRRGRGRGRGAPSVRGGG